ncbi:MULTISPECIES: adenylate/guanylate cyclase domain-containing protein [unclassified Bradyrhizobium]|uniref:adenylate/guanylate cyclase domain-containing protein n=1 Tax=unclassified Bradyrhizobium TaxID=2631580 RepID=UPI002479DD72|nr:MULTISPECIES: adenylate/guanylate cyclase domain-containing protein [unclassified Bradyrhizobium]WGR73118.1 adenylate/guanylate cyclase domain-containing protein [Bradyrhizobium sp. ISRA426]WGR77958.1 adenylate/guanylate cyclase domain-containing protein [Bradyrhizobium sp. ISRA430]WGR88359.1 adenylate/guanylate cyclase domain-containing protein [Bradyrhizobium sp. ISRA432]
MIEEGRYLQRPEALLSGVIDHLLASGIPLSRVRLSPRVLSPVSWATGLLWSRRSGSIEKYEVPHDISETPGFAGSPFDVIYRTERPFRRRLDRIQPRDHRMLAALKESGETDYLAIPMRFSDGSLHAVSFSTDRESGWKISHVAALEDAAQGLAIALEPMVLRRQTRELLATYIGREQASRVLDGHVRRGFHTTLETPMMFADVAGFTRMSNVEPIDKIVALLDDYFGALSDAVSKHSGEVLKFIGDGLLSIFPPCNGESPDMGRRRAYSALLDAREKLGASGRSLAFRVALHFGQVAYGNVGGIDRLDFTVVGPAVNLASRLQAVAKEIGREVLATREFAANLDEFEAIGSVKVRDFSDEIELFAPRVWP